MPKKTTYYHLNQYEPGDVFHRTDFNADNAAIDEALHDKAKAKDLAELFTWGSYIGGGSYGDRTISLGFRPRIVIIQTEYGVMYYSRANYGGISIDGLPLLNEDKVAIVTVTDDGFLLHYAAYGGLDINNVKYHYIVIK